MRQFEKGRWLATRAGNIVVYGERLHFANGDVMEIPYAMQATGDVDIFVREARRRVRDPRLLLCAS